ncbi:hypothetical protein G6F46_015442 [Rhizopus delemar]|nr:hypothetical protein G6F46_015442 [Rhizopus delemar]
MQCVHGNAEAAAEPRQGLRGQADFRHQHQRLPALCQAMDDRLQVDLGLATAGYAIQQDWLEAGGRVDRGHRSGHDGLLLPRSHPRSRTARQRGHRRPGGGGG